MVFIKVPEILVLIGTVDLVLKAMVVQHVLDQGLNKTSISDVMAKAFLLPKVRDPIQKVFFFFKCYIITVLNFFLERFVPKNGVPKNEFSIVFSKSDFGGGGQFFPRHFFLKKPNTPEYAGGNVGET